MIPSPDTPPPPSRDAPHEFHLSLSGHEWTIEHAGVVLSHDDESAYLRALREKRTDVPYGVALWPSAISLAHELSARAEEGFLAKHYVLELGAGTGLPGIVAATLGASHVVQTDASDEALTLCRRNGTRNQVTNLTHQRADWTRWTDTTKYDLIIGSDILYADPLHADLRRIFERNLAPGGTILIADPFRAVSLRLLEALEADGWHVGFTKWTLGEQTPPRPIGVFHLSRAG